MNDFNVLFPSDSIQFHQRGVLQTVAYHPHFFQCFVTSHGLGKCFDSLLVRCSNSVPIDTREMVVRYVNSDQ